ncbi:MAG: energy-coupling factor transporter transmembrane protein EcfT [Aigarchaeota archaeon]|nr:energy-coupling factor transporter transmembrane protein EcfT [Candidatus Pelearchaeum maunauluense]
MALSLFEGLRFKPGKSFVHKLDPRAKLLTSLLILITAFMYTDVVIISILLFLEYVLIRVAGVSGMWLKTLRGALPLATIIFVITFFTRMTDKGITFITFYESFAFAYRLVVFLSSFSLFFLTTTPEEITLTLTKLRIPYQYTFAFVSAIRFTPVLAEEMQSIMDAQRARGLELDKGGFLQRIRKMIPVLVPLLVNVLRRSYELAEAMEVKCFGVSKNRTYLKELRPTGKDYAFTAVVIALFTIVVVARIFYIQPALHIFGSLGLLG